MARPWNYWYHVTSNTYGTWLRGDGRGWRARHHREHVDGDYKNPPPPWKYEELHKQSRALLKQPPVLLTWEQRLIVCSTMAEALEFHNIWFEEIAIAAKHFHLLAQFPPDRVMSTGRPILDPPRHFTGIAKKESARRLSKLGLRPEGGAWAARSHPEPIEDQWHWGAAKKYVYDHHKQGAVVYSIHVAPQLAQ